ncbi:YciI family protein [Lentzea sp. NPDC042327]|uniref:YciI family protein n=1 Tax=Lentzea sp. NPDC042327 TaxID=3154801 RepID=UPI00340EEE42
MLVSYGGAQEDWEGLAAWTDEDMHRMIGYMRDLDAELRATGELLQSEGLSGPARAFVVRGGEDGVPNVVDGPFAESKEVIAGYWVVDVDSRERLLEICQKASACPGPGGKVLNQPIEVHPIMGAPDVDQDTLAPYKQ